MQSACRFVRRGMRVAPHRGRPGPAQAGRAPGGDAIARLLAELRGREVTLQVGARLRTGTLITADPVVLVDGEGRATFVRPDAIAAVTFRWGPLRGWPAVPERPII